MDYLIVTIRTIIFYLLITFSYRLMGKREVGQLGIIDLIVSILIAELAAMSIENKSESVFLSVIPIIFLTIIQIVMSYISMKTNKVRDIFDGTPSVIINKGKINFKEMIRQRYNLDDLLSQLRLNGIKNINDVYYAVLESSGTLSVFKKNDINYNDYPLPLILDGVIQEDTLKNINHDEEWIKKTLSNKNIDLDNVFYSFYKDDNLYIIRKSELTT